MIFHGLVLYLYYNKSGEEIEVKKILVLTGSPRENGNSDLLAEAFIEGARQAGHETAKFKAGLKQIQGCMACKACWSKDRACVIRDGFTELEPLLEAADMIVFATPLYWFGMPAQLKAAIDRFYAYNSDACRRPLKASECVLLACGNDEGPEIFDGLIASYKSMANYLDWKDRGIVTVNGVDSIGDIKNTDALERAKKLGKSI